MVSTLLALTAVASTRSFATASRSAGTTTNELIAGRQLYRQFCGKCHALAQALSAGFGSKHGLGTDGGPSFNELRVPYIFSVVAVTQPTGAARGRQDEDHLEAAQQGQFRLNNTSAPRLIAVLNAVKNASGWKTRPSPSPKAATTGSEPIIGQGCSVMLRSNAYWGCAVQVSVVPKTGKVRVLNVTTAVDPGIVINPLQLQRNAEGGTVQGVSEALHEQVAFNKGAITSRDWVSFPILRIADMPKIKVVILNNPSVGAYGGAGEGPNGFVAAAVASAVYEATGKQPRRLPLVPKYIRALLNT